MKINPLNWKDVPSRDLIFRSENVIHPGLSHIERLGQEVFNSSFERHIPGTKKYPKNPASRITAIFSDIRRCQ